MNSKQILSTILVILGVLTASAAQLTDLFGPQVTKTIISVSTLLMSVLAGIQGVFSTQGSLVRDVQAMPGVEKILVNEKANDTLATLATDPLNLKIEAKPGAEAAVASTAANV